jgi:hypothetical protein
MRGRLIVSVCALGALVWVCAAGAGVPNRPLRTGVYIDPGLAPWSGSPPALAFNRIVSTGATSARITLYWYQVAPAAKPVTWDPANPADPNYRWGNYDALVQNAVRRGLTPLITIMAAPTWAQGPFPQPPLNSDLPDPTALGQFAKAAARRYGGTFHGLPRVRWWQAWNEPNISLYLVPQLESGQPVSPAWYRKMLNAFANSVHSVHANNLVVTGGLAPFRDITPGVVSQDPDWGPLSFMRNLLCLSKSLQPTCSDKATFDVWAMHPYTSGGPLHHAQLPNDVSLGDLPEVRQTLNAAVRAHHINSRGPVQFWVTEFSWDSYPPDPQAIPMSLLSRWVAEGMYRMWQNGVSLVTWLMLRDQPLSPTSYLQSGLYFEGQTLQADRPKPILKAFRFPLVALPSRSRVLVWGRTPAGKPGRVVVQRSFKGGWSQLAIVRTNRYGIFQRTFKTAPTGSIRARVFGRPDFAVPFGIPPVPDHFYNPFGGPGFEPNP